MNGIIRKKLMEAENPLKNMNQQYERATNLDTHQRESKQEEVRLSRRMNVQGQKAMKITVEDFQSRLSSSKSWR